MERIAVDMDEVMADAVGEHLRRYNRDFDEKITLDDLKGKWLWDIVSENRRRALDDYLHSADFFESLAVMADAERVLERLQTRYEVFIATAAMEVPTSFDQKFRWLAKHFPFIPASRIVYCGDKSIIRADYLIDDNPRQLQRFTGERILFSAPHNAGVTEFRRANNWLEVEQLFFPPADTMDKA